MKKRFFSTLALAIAVVTRMLAADVTSGDISASPKVGDSFTVKTGSAYTITYTITKAVSGTASDALFTQGEVELTKFEFGSSTNQSNYEQLYEAGYLYVYYDSPTISQAQKRGGYCVTSIGAKAFAGLKSLRAITLDYAEKDIQRIKIGDEAFRNDTKFYALYAKNNKMATTFPEFSSVGKFAFSNTGLTMTVKANGDIEESAFNNCKIAQFYMQGHHKLSKNALANCGYLNYVEVGGNDIDPEAIYNTTYELIVSWTGGSANASDVKKSPFYGVRDEIIIVKYSGDIPSHYFEEFPNLKELWSDANLVYPNGQYKNPKIGSRAFMNCKKLKLIQIGGAIGDDAFYGCSAINSIVWRGGDPYEGRTDLSGALYYDAPFIDICGQITSFKFESTPVTTPARGLCAYMVNLKEVTIPFMGNTLGDYLFSGCSKLETVTFDWGEYDTDKYSYNFELSKGIFAGCTALKEVKNLPKCLTVVHSSAFSECTSLHRNPVTLNHKKLTTIESYAFDKSAIDTLYIPENVTKMGGGAFPTSGIVQGTTNLKVIVYMPVNLTRKQVGGSYLNMFDINLGGSGHSTESVEAVYLNQVGLTAIPDSMFVGWINLKGVYPINATTLQPSEYASFPNLTTIGKAAFMRTTSLETCRPLAAGTKITKIDDYAFYKSAVSVDIYDLPKLTEIGKYAFAESGITSFAAGYQGKANANTDYRTCNLEKLTTIGENAFKDCSKLTKVGFPYSLKTIGKDAFSGCPVTSIIWAPADYSYANPLTNAGIDKTKITSADIATATVVPDEFLMGAPIKTLAISSYVEKLGKSAFAETANLDSVYINTPLNKQESTKDAEGPFYHSAVKKAQFGKMATKVAENLFGYALELNWVDMPKVTAIGSRAFRDTKLKDVVLRDVTEIGEGAFYNFQTSYKYDSFTIYGKYLTDENAVRMAFSKPGDSPRSSWAVYNVYGSCNTYTELLKNEGWKDMSSSISQLEETQYTLEPNKAGIKQGEGTVDEDDSHYCEGYITLKATPKEGSEFMYWFPQSAVKYYGEVDPTNPEITLQLDKYKWPYILAVFAKPEDFIDLTLNVEPADVGHIEIYNEIGIQMAEPKFLKDERAQLVP
ncbi:MAG: leucine-rich repeat protein, partial [Paludibacteraceae bacterium]|nr:leucine-rich repeat protein [Paludibacteraceae bacterium]